MYEKQYIAYFDIAYNCSTCVGDTSMVHISVFVVQCQYIMLQEPVLII